MNVLIACESSGIVRDAFTRLGHNATSCDFLPAAPTVSSSLYDEVQHIEGDVLEVLRDCGSSFDLMIAHPPCTYLSASGLHWNLRRPERQQLTEEALEFVQLLMDAPIERIAIENPVGCISTRIRKPDQYIQPYEFGHDASKKTGLWLKGLPLLKNTRHIPGRLIGPTGHARLRWDNQTDSGQNKLGPSEDRWSARARTYEGIAWAMASQWSKSINDQPAP